MNDIYARPIRRRKKSGLFQKRYQKVRVLRDIPSLRCKMWKSKSQKQLINLEFGIHLIALTLEVWENSGNCCIIYLQFDVKPNYKLGFMYENK